LFLCARVGESGAETPTSTQPLMYKAIRSHPSTLEVYGKKLVAEGVVGDDELETMRTDWRAKLDIEFEASQSYKANSADWLDGRWADIKFSSDAEDPRRGNTGVALPKLKDIRQKVPEGPE